MTEAGPGASHRRVPAPFLIVALAVVAIAVGVGGGFLMAAATGPAGTSEPSGTAFAIAPGTSPTAGIATPPPSPSPTPEPTPEPTPILVPAPLTGLPVGQPATVQHPIAIMVDDQKDARPQAGFNAADVVWQAPAEGGIPRYMLIFQSRLPTSVGPIRSARQYYIEWAAEWRAIYAHIGGSGQAQRTLAAEGRGQLVFNADGFRFDGSDMYRVSNRPAPHNLFSDAKHLRSMEAAIGAKDGPLTPVWAFGAPLDADARPVGTTITIHYPYETITYRYDPPTNTYLRYIDRAKAPQVDAADGKVVAPVNVVILRMRFGPLNDGHPEKKRLEASDVGSGEAIISSNGHVIRGKWKKASITAPTLLFDAAGKALTLTAGQTFVQVIPLTYAFEIHRGAVPDIGRQS